MSKDFLAGALYVLLIFAIAGVLVWGMEHG